VQLLIIGPFMSRKRAKPRKKPHPQNSVVRAAFGSVIRQLRRKLRLTQRELAERSGYSEKYIGFLELRKNNPSLTAAIMISRGLEQDPGKTVNEVSSLMARFKRLEGKDHQAADF
jgi:transcriptional regulator with XRE-family HTH domain